SCSSKAVLCSASLHAMSQVEASDLSSAVSTARSDLMQEYGEMIDAQRRIDDMQLNEEDDGEESLVEMTAVNETEAETEAQLSVVSAISTGYDGSVTGDDLTSCDLTDDLISIYSDHEDSQVEVECPTFFTASMHGNAMAMDSIEAMDKLPGFVPIPVDFDNFSPTPIALRVVEKIATVAEVTARAGDTDSCTTSPYHNYYKEAGLETADITSYAHAPSQTDVTIALSEDGLCEGDEGLCEDDFSVYSMVEKSEREVEVPEPEADIDLTEYSLPKSECSVSMDKVSFADITAYSVQKSERDVTMMGMNGAEDFSEYSVAPSERCIEMLDTHSIYSEGVSELEVAM
ncbi:hypothetical protein PFISCL1PPCAC_16068, partial [Pristionchus fissidentatus]